MGAPERAREDQRALDRKGPSDAVRDGGHMLGSDSMNLPRDVAHLSTQELRDLTTALIAQLSVKDEQLTAKDEELKFKQLKIDQLTHEMAVLRRWRFGRRSERLDPTQRSLLEESIDEDLEAISLELEALRGKHKREERPKDKPRRTALPPHLPRREI